MLQKDIYYPTIYREIVNFLLCHGSLYYCPGPIVLDIDWNYTMAWFSTLLLITRMLLSTCATKMHIWFVFARTRYVKMRDMRHGFFKLKLP